MPSNGFEMRLSEYDQIDCQTFFDEWMRLVESTDFRAILSEELI